MEERDIPTAWFTYTRTYAGTRKTYTPDTRFTRSRGRYLSSRRYEFPYVRWRFSQPPTGHSALCRCDCRTRGAGRKNKKKKQQQTRYGVCVHIDIRANDLFARIVATVLVRYRSAPFAADRVLPTGQNDRGPAISNVRSDARAPSGIHSLFQTAKFSHAFLVGIEIGTTANADGGLMVPRVRRIEIIRARFPTGDWT